jgi:hypothetical protein
MQLGKLVKLKDEVLTTYQGAPKAEGTIVQIDAEHYFWVLFPGQKRLMQYKDWMCEDAHISEI